MNKLVGGLVTRNIARNALLTNVSPYIGAIAVTASGINEIYNAMNRST